MLYVKGFVEPSHLFAIITLNGKQVGLYHKIIGKDGKTMTQTYKGIDDEGKPMSIIKILVKQ